MTGTEWTDERAFVAARNSEDAGFRWLFDVTAENPEAHSFPREFGWMTARCGRARWTVNWWPVRDDMAHCPECSEMSEAAVARGTAAILAVAARGAVAS
jgi:hypothetical protein